MKSLRSSGKQKRPSLLIRQIAGVSMRPSLRPGQIVIASGRAMHLQVGDVVVFRHNGMEKIKRLAAIDQQKGVFVRGDNGSSSTDSRHFGWLPLEAVMAKVYWPL